MFMTRYFFDLKFGDESPTHDEEGGLYANFATAQVEATRALSDLSSEMVQSGRDANSLAVVVRDGDGPVMQAALHFEMKRLN
jgi:hypothetical protein